MRLFWATVAAVLAAWVLVVPGPPPTREAVLRRALLSGAGVVELPAGVTEISVELTVGPKAHDLEVRGAPSGTTLRTSDRFRGRALIVCESARRIRFTGFTIDGNRAALERRSGLPPSNLSFAEFTRGNGILALRVTGLSVASVRFVEVPGFAVLASESRELTFDRVEIADSGSRNALGRNNTTGGILLEEGTENFQITRSTLRNVRGNGIWTHSRYTSPRNRNGLIAENHLEQIGRDAAQVGHAARVRVENNTGRLIGFPVEIVDVEGRGMPVAIDTAGNTDDSIYQRNRFEEINGKCIDLDGFHDGEVRANTCANRHTADQYPYGHYGIVMNNSNPDMQSQGVRIVENEIDGAVFGGIFVIGSKNLILRNHLRRLNLAHCPSPSAVCSYAPDQPDLLRSGIYLGAGAERPAPAHTNVIEENDISGFGLQCIAAAPGVSLEANTIVRNKCKEDRTR
ncbi:MAG: right-handed parallel beta-helix repeat-containing protein [Acidobacteriia bacterium]|nr:right-handed parallel beta-helix repeat-containing protein [Terriglobia bacterium]